MPSTGGLLNWLNGEKSCPTCAYCELKKEADGNVDYYCHAFKGQVDMFIWKMYDGLQRCFKMRQGEPCGPEGKRWTPKPDVSLPRVKLKR